MIEADNASTSIYQVLRMSRAAKTHLLIVRMSSIFWPRKAVDILTTRLETYQQDILVSQSFLGGQKVGEILDKLRILLQHEGHRK